MAVAATRVTWKQKTQMSSSSTSSSSSSGASGSSGQVSSSESSFVMAELVIDAPISGWDLLESYKHLNDQKNITCIRTNGNPMNTFWHTYGFTIYPMFVVISICSGRQRKLSAYTKIAGNMVQFIYIHICCILSEWI